MAKQAPTNSDDIIDSRDVIERIDELTYERDDLQTALDDAKAAFDEYEYDPDSFETTEAARTAVTDVETAVTEAETALADWESSYGDELKALEALAAEGADYAEDWTYGATLVRASYFTEYCQEMLEDIGELPRDLPSYIVIDWEATARNLKADYTEIDFDGVSYLVR